MTQSAQADLKESKDVMEDEGGANLASLKKQQVDEAKAHAKKEEPDTCGCGPVTSEKQK